MDAADIVESYLAYLKDEQDSIPVTALDYSSLYPSLIMAYNLSPEMLIRDESEAMSLDKEYDLHSIDFEYKYTDYEKNHKTDNIRSWTVRHDNNIIESSKKQSNFGLYPSILFDLFNQRAEMKKSLEHYERRKEHIEKYVDDYSNDEEYQDVLFNLNYCDTKQKALKVYMNCFYGELGNQNSPLFILDLAGGITSMGQENLRKVKKFIEDKECKIYYGDTDSLYFSFNKSEFTDLTSKYIIGDTPREQYASDLVNRTFDLVKILSKEVNNYLISDNNTKFLKMAYEEVLYPVTFLSRKKYYGVAHKEIVNFKPKKLFIRGLEVKKRGVSEILKIVCMETMWESMCVYNNKSLLELVEEKIDYIYTHKWRPEDFIQTGLYKPGKKNVSLNRFNERMIEAGRDELIPYERFNYVIVKITDTAKLFNFRGTKLDIKKGDRMEYLDYVLSNDLEIDLDYYFEKQLTGQFARLICYHERFFDVSDDKIMNKCRKYVTDYANKYSTSKLDGERIKENYNINKLQKSKLISGNKRLKLLFTDIGITDNYTLTYEKAKSFVNIDNLNADAIAIIKDLKSRKLNVQKMFCIPLKSKVNYRVRMQTHYEKELGKLINEFIKYCNDKKITSLILHSQEAICTEDVDFNLALNKLVNIASCIKELKLLDLILKNNINLISKNNNNSIPDDFRL